MHSTQKWMEVLNHNPNKQLKHLNVWYIYIKFSRKEIVRKEIVKKEIVKKNNCAYN